MASPNVERPSPAPHLPRRLPPLHELLLPPRYKRIGLAVLVFDLCFYVWMVATYELPVLTNGLFWLVFNTVLTLGLVLVAAARERSEGLRTMYQRLVALHRSILFLVVLFLVENVRAFMVLGEYPSAHYAINSFIGYYLLNFFYERYFNRRSERAAAALLRRWRREGKPSDGDDAVG